MDWILDFLGPNPTPVAYNRIRTEVFFPEAGSGLDLDFVFTEKTLLVVCLTYISGLKQESDCLNLVGTGLDPDSKRSESEHL